MNRNFLTIALSMICLFGCALVFSACSSNDATSIEVTGSGVYTEFEVGEQLDLENINVKVEFKDGTSISVKGSDSGVVVTGFDSSTARLDGKLVVTYDKATAEVPYKVYAAANFINSQTDVSKLGGELDTLIIKNAGTYDVSAYPITRNLTLIGRLNRDIRVTGMVVNNGAANNAAINVTLQNLSFINKEANQTKLDTVVFKTARTTGTKDVFTMKNCKVIANGETRGVSIANAKRSEFYMEYCSFTTPNTTDVFNYLFTGNGTTRYLDTVVSMKNSKFDCAFWYGLSSTVIDVFEGNYVASQVKAGSFLEDTTSRDKLELQKNPVWFHYNLGTASSNYMSLVNSNATAKISMSCKNNTFKGLESVVRIYGYDYLTTKSKFQWNWDNNTFENVNVLLLNSSASYSGVSAIAAVVSENNTVTGYTLKTKSLIEKNTPIDLAGASAMSMTSTGATLYFNLATNPTTGATYQTKGTTDAANKFIYVGSGAKGTSGEVLGGISNTHVLKQGDNFYVITINYSADGKDDVKFYNGAGYYLDKNQAQAYNLNQIREMMGCDNN